MNESQHSDPTAAGPGARTGSATDSPAATVADDANTAEAASGSEKSDRAPAADASKLAVTATGESIGQRPDSTLADDSIGLQSDATLAGESIGLEPERTLASRSVPDHGGSSPSPSPVDETTIAGDVAINPTLPGSATLAEGMPTARSQRPKPTVTDYEILDELGRGGMGVVYLARQVRLNRLCALKMILAGDHASKDAALRFQTEAETIARLRHANIAQIYHIGDCDGRVFFEMEFIEGGSLEAKLDGTPWPAHKAAALIEALASGVGQAHQLGIIHRDLKPGNILMETNGTPKIADFGLAKTLNVQSGLTQTDSILGSPSYMAPEQAEGHARTVGPAADVYALGAILYELLTGRPPFKSATILETLDQVKKIEPVSPSRLVPGLPPDIETICLKCLQKEPVKRYASAAALEEDLRRYQAGESIVARRINRAERAWRWCRRNPATAGLVASLLIVLAGGFAATTVLWVRAERLRAEAEENFHHARNAVDDYLTRVAESRLLGVPGLQPLRRELLESALPYYESFVKKRAEDPALAHELASAYGRLAKINADLGRGPEALKGYQKALEILARRTAQPGTDDSRLEAEVARYHQAKGDVHRQAENLTAALQSYQAAEAIWRKLTGLAANRAERPAIQSSWSEGLEQHDALAILLDRIGTVHEKAGELEKAVRCYGEAVQIEWDVVHSEKKPRDASGLHHHLARMFTKIGDLQVEMRMEPGALRWVVGNAVTDTSDFGSGAGDRFPFYRRAETILSRLIGEIPTDPRINDFRRDLADCHEHNAEAMLRIERSDEASSSYRAALEIRQRLARENPAVTEYQEGLARITFGYGVLLDSGGKRDEALLLYRQAVDHQRVVVATSPAAIPPRRALAQQLAKLGDAERRVGRPAQALDDYREASELFAGLPQPTADDLYALATAHAARAGLAGQGKAKLTEQERALVNQSAGTAVAAFSRAIDAGFEGHDRAKKDAALDPLRSRDDFKKLMARLAELSKGAEWLTDFDAAKRQAAAQGKDIFIYFSGSDWCPWCLLIKRTVFDRPAFARYAARNFVLLQLDNPQRTAPPANAATRDALVRKWQVNGVPTVILADARGRPYADVANSGSEEDRRNYTGILDRHRQARDARDRSLLLAAAAQGVERARFLDQALSALTTLPTNVVMVDYADLISQIFATDPENRALLKAKYARYAEVAWKARHDEALEALQQRDWQGAVAQCDAILAELKPTGQSAQETRVSRALALKGLGKNADAEAEFARAIELDRKAIDLRRAAFGAAPGDVDRRAALSEAYSHLIATLRKSGRWAEAAASALQRQELWPGNSNELYNAACELALSVPAPEAVRAAGKEEHQPANGDSGTTGRKIADQAMETLRRSVLTGFADARWMSQDPDLEILHARDDFRALVRSLRELGGPATPVSELRRYVGHQPNSLTVVVASPDGRHLLSAAVDKTLRQWELETGREVRRMGTTGQVLALALSRDGRRALTGGIDKVVQLWDVGSGTELKHIALDSRIGCLAFSADGRGGLAGLGDSTIRLLDLDAGKEILRFQGHTSGTVRTVAVAPDGLRALSGGDDMIVRLWDLKTGRELRRLAGFRSTIWSLAFAPDGRHALAGCDDGLLLIWDTSDWREVHRLESASGDVRSVAFLPDSHGVVSAHGSGKLTVRDLDSGREVLKLHGIGSRPALAVVPDGKRVLTAGAEGLVRLWSLDQDLVRPRELDLLGRWTEAGASLEKSLRARPDDPRLWILRGRHDMLLGHWDHAAVDYRRAIELGRGDTGVLALVASALQVEPPSSGEGAQRLLDFLDPQAPHAVTLWMKLGRPVLGVNGAHVKDGISLMALDPKGAAAKAGFQVGDVLSEVAGKPVVDPDSLRAALKGFVPGDQVTVNSRRGTSSFRRTVTLGSTPIPFVARQDQPRQALDTDHHRFLDAGYRPAYITAYLGRRREPTYAGLWLKDDRPFLARVGATADVFEKQSRELPAGYRLGWLGISGDAKERRWSAVWVADPDRVPWDYHDDLGRSQLSSMIDRRAGEGYRPTIIRAYHHSGEEIRYSGVWIKDSTPFQARVHLTADDLKNQIATLSSGWRPDWVNVYKEKGSRFYTAIFIKDDGRAEWQLTIDTPEWGMQTIFKTLSSEEGFAPVLLDLE